MTQTLYLDDMTILRDRARGHIDRRDRETDNPRAARDTVLQLLNAALATELLSLVRCKRHYYASDGASEALREEFLEQAVEESMNTDRLVERILQLGGLPDFSAQGLSDVVSSDASPKSDLRELIREDLAAQRMAIESYREIARFIGSDDQQTCNVLESIVRRDQQYIERLSRHLADLSPPRGVA